MTKSSNNTVPDTAALAAHNETTVSSPLSIPSVPTVYSASKPRVSLRESLPTYLYTPANKTYEYRAEDDLEGEPMFYARSRCSSISPVLTRDPIAPGIYTRVRKRSLTPLDEGQGLDHDASPAPKDPTPLAGPPLSAGQPCTPAVQAATSSLPVAKATLASKIHEEDALSEEGTGLPIIQEFILDSQFRITIEGRRQSRWKAALYYLLCILSGGIVFLLSKWFPRIRSQLTTHQSALAHSSHVYVKNSYHQSELVPVRRSYYGKLLTQIFGSQKLHECLVVDEKEGVYLKQENYAGPEGNPALRLIAEGGEGTEDAALMYTHKETANPLQHAPAEHASVEDSSSFSPSLLEKGQGAKPSPSDFLYFFEYRCIRFIYHPNLGRYFENSQWESFQSTNYTKLTEGITDSTATQRSIIYGENLIDIKRKSIFRLFIDEVLHPFNVFQIFSIILWCNEMYYYYAGAIFLISSYTIALTIYETRKNLANLIEVSRFRCELRIFRDGKWSLQSSTSLVPGDIFEPHMTMTCTLPCDALLLEGDCIMNESMLTGESLPVAKCPLEEALWDSSKGVEDAHRLALSSEKSILFAGTRLVRVRGVQDQPARAVAIRTGFNTTKGHLIRNILFQRPINFKFYRDAMRFIYILAAIAGAGFSLTLYSFISRSVELSTVFVRALDLITVVIPPALPASMAIGVTFAMSRLKMKNIYCISPPRINVCGKINLFCFDKTGTLTEEGLDLLGAHIHVPEAKAMGPLLESMPSIMKQVEKEDLMIRSLNSSAKLSTPLPMAQWMVVGMAACHSVKSVNEGHLIGDPLDVKMFQFTGWQLEDGGYSNEGSLTIVVKPPGPSALNEQPALERPLHLPELGIIRCFEFVPALRRMSVLVKAYQGFGMSAFVKGAPESIRDICTPSSLPTNFDSILTHYTSSGYRVIALATRSFPTLNWARAQKLHREEVELDLTFLGFLVFENRLKPVTKDVIHVLATSKFRTTISTGDNILTAMSVAKECKIVPLHATVFLPRLLSSPPALAEPGAANIVWESTSQPEESLSPFTLQPLSSKPLDYTLGCTGHVLEYLIDHCPTDILYSVLMKCNVYARMSPDQKQRLVECFQKIEYCVGFCGDGANDCGALKAADVGLSLSDAEASIAAPFTSKTTDIRCTLDLVLEGRSALVTSFSCFKFMALYSLIQLTTLSLLYYYITNLSDGQFIYIDLLIIIPLAICFGRLKSNPHITSKRPTANLVSKKVLCSIIGQIVIHIAFQTAVFLIAVTRPWCQQPVVDEDHDHTPSQINTIMFIFTTFQYLIVAFIFTSNAPFQKSILVNPMFMLSAIAILVMNLVFLLFPPDWLVDLMNMVDSVPNAFRMFLLALALANCVAAYFCEIGCYKILQFVTRYRKKKSKKKVKLFKKLLAAQSLMSSFGEPEKAV